MPNFWFCPVFPWQHGAPWPDAADSSKFVSSNLANDSLSCLPGSKRRGFPFWACWQQRFSQKQLQKSVYGLLERRSKRRQWKQGRRAIREHRWLTLNIHSKRHKSGKKRCKGKMAAIDSRWLSWEKEAWWLKQGWMSVLGKMKRKVGGSICKLLWGLGWGGGHFCSLLGALLCQGRD